MPVSDRGSTVVPLAALRERRCSVAPLTTRTCRLGMACDSRTMFSCLVADRGRAASALSRFIGSAMRAPSYASDQHRKRASASEEGISGPGPSSGDRP